MKLRLVKPVGCCRFCKCTREHPCALANGDECAFVNQRADCCSNPACIKAGWAEYDRLLEADRQRQALYRKLRNSTRKSAKRRRAA